MQFRGPGGDWSRAPGPRAQRKREWETVGLFTGKKVCGAVGRRGGGERREPWKDENGFSPSRPVVTRQVPARAKWWSWRPLPSRPLDRPSGSLFKYLTLYRSPPFTWTRLGVRARTFVGVHLPKFHRRCYRMLLLSTPASSSDRFAVIRARLQCAP